MEQTIANSEAAYSSKKDPKGSDERLRVVYYPFSRCLDATSLKRLVLLFDEILFVDPLAEDLIEPSFVFRWRKPDTRVRKRITHAGQGPSVGEDALENTLLHQLRDWYNIEPLYEPLCEKGIVRFYNPSGLVRRHDKLLTQSAIADSEDPDFRPFLFDEQEELVMYSQWLLYRSRIPRSLRHYQKQLAIPTMDLPAAAIADDWLAEKADSFANEEGNDGEGEIEDLDSRLVEANFRFIRHNLEKKKAVALPFRLGLSLTISQALLIAEEESVIPLTDTPLMHKLLLKKYEKAAKRSDAPSQEIIARRTLAERLKFELLSLNVAARIVPNSELSQRSIQEIVRYRENCKDELRRFRALLWSLTDDIESQPLSPEFRKDILKVIDQKIEPELQKLSDQMQSTYEKMFGQLALKVGKAALKALAGGLSPLVLAAVGGLNPGLALALSASTAASVGLLSLPELVDYWQNKKILRRNSVAYLASF
jgi:hypothetical protein